ncbi:MAG TPA: hypothetical protein VMT58_01980, partial [Candidatus Binataceae bacterium]|nr:hypothetical protein [Candidatus Binataceae bacterium]
MTERSSPEKSRGKRLNSWKEIAAYLQKDVRTVQRWEKGEGLPVHRKPHEKLSSVYAYESELEQWWTAGSHPAPGAPTLAGRPGAGAGRPALVILPLRNLSGDPEQEYFSDGLTEELIGQVGRIDPVQLGVIARASAMKYKESTKGIAQISSELGVRYVMEGSVRRNAAQVRISIALIRASDQTCLWSESYDRNLRDIIAVQTEVAHAVAMETAGKVSAAERSRMAANLSVDPDSYSAYLRGRYFWNRRAADSLEKALAYFEEAIALDRTYAPAYAGLADCYVTLASIYVGARAPVEAMPKASAAAERAISIDPSLAEAHASLGQIQLRYQWDWPAAESCFKRSLELKPSYLPARQWYAVFLQTIDRVEDAMAEITHSLEMDPLSLTARTALEAALYLERKYDRVIEES